MKVASLASCWCLGNSATVNKWLYNPSITLIDYMHCLIWSLQQHYKVNTFITLVLSWKNWGREGQYYLCKLLLHCKWQSQKFYQAVCSIPDAFSHHPILLSKWTGWSSKLWLAQSHLYAFCWFLLLTSIPNELVVKSSWLDEKLAVNLASTLHRMWGKFRRENKPLSGLVYAIPPTYPVWIIPHIYMNNSVH